jgi:hypothetical protein
MGEYSEHFVQKNMTIFCMCVVKMEVSNCFGKRPGRRIHAHTHTHTQEKIQTFKITSMGT